LAHHQHHVNEIVKFFTSIKLLLITLGALFLPIREALKAIRNGLRKLKSYIDSHTQARQGKINPRTGEVTLKPKKEMLEKMRLLKRFIYCLNVVVISALYLSNIIDNQKNLLYWLAAILPACWMLYGLIHYASKEEKCIITGKPD
jgi:hypothetical protein